MLTILTILSMPAMAHANINSNTSASSNTGGNVVGQGGTVTTGDAVSSVQVSNTSAQGTSSSSVYIKTEANGVVHEETYTSDKADTSVRVETTPKGSTIEVREGTPPTVVRQEFIYASTSSSTAADSGTSTEASAVASTEGLGVRIILAVQNFFAGLLGWFR
ncbi:MAG TPA: hypothetical protein VJJ20_03400 [Candidatus Paceibacterota bacterium]